MLVGYARVLTKDQSPHLQLDALKSAGCEKVFEEKASGAKRDRPELIAALGFMRAGDTLVVWKLDRLARSLKQLMETVDDLSERGIGFRSLTETPRRRAAVWCSTSSGRSPSSSAASSANAPRQASTPPAPEAVPAAVHARSTTTTLPSPARS
jgi:hypothetical protein